MEEVQENVEKVEKIDKKEAKRLAKEKLLLQLKRDYLTREQAIDDINREKLRDKWFNAILNIKVPEMRENLRHIFHYMEKLIEGDTYRNLLFEEERREIDEMTSLQSQNHTVTLDRLYDIYLNRVKDLNDAYNNSVKEKRLESINEFSQMENREALIQENMQTMLFQMGETRNQKEDGMNCEMFLKLDDERSKNTEKRENLRSKLERKMERRWAEITLTLHHYDQNTLERRKHYAQLKAKDDADSKIIYQQMKKTQKLFEQLETLRGCYDECYAPPETISMITDLRDEKQKFYSAFKHGKKLLAEELKVDEEQLKHLTAVASTCTTELKRLCNKGEQILTLFRIIRKFETQQEKIAPVGGNFSLIKGTEAPKQQKPPEEPSVYDSNAENSTKEYEVLNLFWKKVGNARLSKLALGKCIQDMEKENSILKKSLVVYLKSVPLRRDRRRHN